MRSIDYWIIFKMNDLTAWTQRRGYRLTSLTVHVTGAAAFIAILNCLTPIRYGPLIFNGIVWFILMASDTLWAHRHHDYPFSTRMMEKLNARVMLNIEGSLERGFRFFSLFMLFIFFPIVALGIAVRDDDQWKTADLILCLMQGVMLAIYFYIRTCIFLGPGEFAKEEKAAYDGEVATENGAP